MKIMAECMLYMYTHGYNYAMVLCEIPYIRIVLEIILVTIDIINIALYVNGKSINNIRREECRTTNTSIHKTGTISCQLRKLAHTLHNAQNLLAVSKEWK